MTSVSLGVEASFSLAPSMHLSAEGHLESDFPLITSEDCLHELGMIGSYAETHWATVKGFLKRSVPLNWDVNRKAKVKTHFNI